MSESNESIRKCVQKVEGDLRSIVEDCVGKWFAAPRCDYEYEQLVELLNCRRDLLDKMFVATTEEVERMEQVKN